MRSTLLIILLLISLAFTAFGATGYLKERIELKKEKSKKSLPGYEYYDPSTRIAMIQQSLYRSAVMFATGCIGVFLFIYKYAGNENRQDIKGNITNQE